MLKDIVAAEPRENYQLHIRFEDGVEEIVDISNLIELGAALLRRQCMIIE